MEIQYLNILKDVLETGEKRLTRNGFTFSKFFKTMSFNLSDGFPLLTTKKVFWKGVVEELLFFIRGDTNTKILNEKGIKIWDGNTTRSFLDNMGFFDYEVGDMGPMYGYQWRFFNKPYNINSSYNGIDQLKNIIEEIKINPYSRRLLLTDFNPEQVNLGVLFPCHSIIIQFYVENSCLSCSMYQRSSDLFLGEPFNIASISLLLIIIAQLTNMTPGMVHLVLGDCHIYNEHIDVVKEQLTRKPYNLCSLKIKKFNTLEEVEKATFDDFIINDYNYHPILKAPLIV